MSKKALVIEDDDQVRYSLVSILKENDYAVTEAQNGQEGVEKFDAGSFNIIFCDIIMPNKDGLTTITDIREKDKSVPIIAISGGGRVDKGDYLTIAHNVGANLTIEKPFDIDDVLSALKISV